jgi:hypothetical protein
LSPLGAVFIAISKVQIGSEGAVLKTIFLQKEIESLIKELSEEGYFFAFGFLSGGRDI